MDPRLAQRHPRTSPAKRSLPIRLLRTVLILGLAASAGAPTEASGHGRSVSYSSWEFTGDSALVTVRMKLLELSRLGPQALPPGSVSGLRAADQRDLPAEFLPRDLILIADDIQCLPESIAERHPDDPGWARYRWRIKCPASASDASNAANASSASNATRLTIRSRILLDVAPSHLHFARVRLGDDSGGVREQILTEASPAFVLRRASTDSTIDELGSGFLDYLELGIRHILSGWDHLAFVLGLLMLARRLGEVARLITGFTIAHSLTLALAVQGLVEPRAAAVEAVIAFSVALVAIEKGWIEHERRRTLPIAVLIGLTLLGVAAALGWASLPLITITGLMLFTACYFALAARNDSPWLRVLLTFAFGLVHGFGFAGVLVEMTLPTDRLVPALLGFNLGVEIGQIAVVLGLWPLLALGARLFSTRTVQLASALSTASLCGLGFYWLLERVSSS
jgi:hypothetical protein